MEDNKFKKVNSPEQLNQYIRLSNPGIWILLIAIVVLLVGFCIWGYFGKIDTKIKTVVVSDNYTSYLYVKEEDIAKIKNGMSVELNNNENTFEMIKTYDELLESPLADGEYAATVTNIESYDLPDAVLK